MPSTQNQALKALPNVLRDQMVPNTLGRVGPPRPVSRRGAPARALAITVVIVFVLVLAVLSRAA